jgi:hypothetical protein
VYSTDRLVSLGVEVQARLADGETDLGADINPAELYGLRFESCPTIIRDGWRPRITGSSGFM